MNPRNINRHQSLARRVREQESGGGGPREITEKGNTFDPDPRNDVSTFVIPTTLFITVAKHVAL